MLETLLKILSWDLPAPEILLEEDGNLGLDLADLGASVSIGKEGGVNWAILEPKAHGTDIEELQRILKKNTLRRS